MLNTFIIEDEPMARKNLERALEENFDDIKPIGSASSIREAVQWLKNPANRPDLIFMDVELSDGKCFEIFRQVDVEAPVVMTTAYDSYAVKAFEAGSVDYLLKPIEPEALKRAVERCRGGEDGSFINLEKVLKSLHKDRNTYRERFLISLNDRIIPVRSDEVAYFFSESKDSRIVTLDGTTYTMDSSLDSISTEVNPEVFFRISRKCIISKDAVGCITKLSGGRLLLEMKAKPRGYSPDFTVSRARVDVFLAWLDR